MKTVIIVPAFNEALVINDVIAKLKQAQIPDSTIVVVDDGSNDGTSEVIKDKNAILLKHPLNLGLGAALATGLIVARRLKAEVAATFDADGQHRVEDLLSALKPVLKGEADVVIGSRLIHSGKMPFIRWLINWMANLLTLGLFGVWTTDSQSGLRVFSKQALEKIVLKTDRMEASSEVFAEISRHKLALVEVPIVPVYTEYSKRKGQKASNSLNIVWKLILRRLRV